MEPATTRKRKNMMISSGSKILLSDSLSRDNSDGSCDAYQEGHLWQHVRIHGTSLRGDPVSLEEAGKDRHVLDMIGRWYAECEHDDRRQPPPKNAAGGPIPWGAVLPVRLDGSDIDQVCSQSIRTWTRLLIHGMQHTFSAFLFYSLREPTQEDREDLERDLAKNSDASDLGPLYWIAVLYPLVEFEAISNPEDSLIDVFSSDTLRLSSVNRRFSIFPKSVPSSAWHVMRPGEVISQTLRYDQPTLENFDRDEQIVSRFVDAYAMAVRELGSNHSVGTRDVVARDYWNARLKVHPEVFTAVDARNRMVLYACYLRAVSLGDNEGAQRIENGLVRLMRYIFELGWPNEHNMISYVHWCRQDKGRVPPELAHSAHDASAAVVVTASAKKRLQHIITSDRSTPQAIEQAYVEGTYKHAMQFEELVDHAPPDLVCLARRARELDRDWIRRADGTYVGLAGEDHICVGDSFVIAEGYPTRFFHESDPDRDHLYTKLAAELFMLLKPSASPSDFWSATLTLTDGRSVLVYPSILFDTLASLRAELRSELVQPCHRVTSGLFNVVGPIDKRLASKDWRLVSPQPSIPSTVEGIKQTLWPSSMVCAEGLPLPVVPTELMVAVRHCKKLYQAGHPSEPSGAPLPAPTVFWLRPLLDIVGSNPAPEAMRILEKLPKVHVGPSGNLALVMAYREWPFAFSEAVRCQLRAFSDRMANRHNKNLALTLRTEFGSENPASLIALSDRINAAILHNGSSGGLCLDLHLITDIQMDELEDHYREQQQQEDEEVGGDEHHHLPIPPRGAPNGLNSRYDLTLERNRKMAAEAGSRKSIEIQVASRAAVFNACDLDPERCRDALWKRDANDPKRSILVEKLEKKDKFPQTFRWRDWQNALGFVSSRSLAAYAYVMQDNPGNLEAVQALFEERRKQKWGNSRFVYELLGTVSKEKRAKFWDFVDTTLKPIYESITSQPPRPDEPAPKKAKNRTGEKTRDPHVQRLWRTGLKLTGAGVTYLRHTRGLYGLSSDVLECSPFLKFATHLVYNLEGEALSDSKIHQALLCFMVDEHGGSEPQALQRIFITEDGRKFVPKSGKAKPSLGPTKGLAWCAQPGRLECLPYVFLCEGPEKALAVAACSRYACCFATMGVSNLRNFAHFRDMVPQPTIVVVGDADGSVSSQENEVRLMRAAGWKRVLLWMPWCALEECRCKDSNDVMMNHGVVRLAMQLAPHLPLWAVRTETVPEYRETPEREWQRYPCLVTK